MPKFVIQPHGRLQEWVAQENGYFESEGLDHEFILSPNADANMEVDALTGKIKEVVAGAYERYQAGGGNKGAKSDISCACHWAVNQASAQNFGHMWTESYAITAGGVMVPPDSSISKPEDLAGQEIAVGYHSGSHFATIQALEPFVKPQDTKLKFIGVPWVRVDAGIRRDVPATSVWGITFQVLEQLGFRKIVDTSFMIGFMFPDSVDRSEVDKYMRALKRAQMALDLAPEKYKHFYSQEIPKRYQTQVDVRRFSPGERIVFLPYTQETYEQTQHWIHARQLFAEQAR